MDIVIISVVCVMRDGVEFCVIYVIVICVVMELRVSVIRECVFVELVGMENIV